MELNLILYVYLLIKNFNKFEISPTKFMKNMQKYIQGRLFIHLACAYTF